MDLKGRLVPLLIAVFLRLLSNNASTASCNILFSFLKITSGAPISINCFKRLFLIIILRYKSFKSLAANLPPSNGTKGLNSGGITGKTEITIHSGWLILFFDNEGRKVLAIFNLFRASVRFCLDFDVSIISSRFFFNSNKFILANISFIASPPIVA